MICCHPLSAPRVDALSTPLASMQQYQVFDFGSRSNPIVLLLDRRDDPVTPLLMQWTYQAMIHELLGINENTVKLNSPKVSACHACMARRSGGGGLLG